MANPGLKPIFLETVAKESSSIDRLAKYAETKNTAEKFGREYNVSTIKAEKGYFTYSGTTRDGKSYIVPNVSFFTCNTLDNDDSYYCWVHFCLDASITPNLDPDMIENYHSRGK